MKRAKIIDFSIWAALGAFGITDAIYNYTGGFGVIVLIIWALATISIVWEQAG